MGTQPQPQPSGLGPIGFTTTVSGGQLSIPLSAFALQGSKVVFSAAWNTSPPVFSTADQTILLALAQAKYASGELTAAVQPPPIPAVTFTAASPGAPGNGITVTVGVLPGGSGSVFDCSLCLDGVETDTFPGLASADAAAIAIGSDTAPVPNSNDPPLGTGLVQFHSAGPSGSGLPEAGTYSITGLTPLAIPASGGGTLFEIVARQAPAAAPYSAGLPAITVTVDLPPGGTTFTLTASYDSGPQTVTFDDLMSALPPALGFLCTAAAPAGGFAVPAAGKVQLSGGGSGIPAAGVAYTPTGVQPPPIPAVTFTAASPGVTGNGITVTVGLVGGGATLCDSSLSLDGKETDAFPGLADAGAAVTAIGSDTAPVNPGDPPLGTGLVQVHSEVTGTGTGLPQAGPYPITNSSPVAIPASNGSGTLFEIVARQAPAAAPYTAGLPAITVTVDLPPGGTTFTLTASYDSGTETVTFEDLTSALPPALGFLIAVTAPAGGFAVPAVPAAAPATTQVQLSGGGTGIPATGVAYTS